MGSVWMAFRVAGRALAQPLWKWRWREWQHRNVGGADLVKHLGQVAGGKDAGDEACGGACG